MGGQNANWIVKSGCEAVRCKAAAAAAAAAADCNWRAVPSGFVETEICVQVSVITVGSGRILGD
jgi:hypothetical protein